jgi:alpha-mannosidase
MIKKTTAHPGVLPKRWGLLEVSEPNVVVSALKPGQEGSVILRVYEASGKSSAGVKVRIQAPVTTAHECNLIEDTGRKLEVNNDTLQFDLRPFEIKTFKLQLRREGKS